jgi:hypothetical protein
VSLKAIESLDVTGGEQNGFIPVRTERDEEGWVSSEYVFYDPDHANHLRRYRATMWELHPVTRIEVFRAGAWVDLDDM